MKSKRLYLLYGIAIAMLPVFLLILMGLDSPSDLLSPPSLYGENSEIQTAFEKSISNSSEIVLQYPSAGEYRSAFVLYDLNGDDNEEAIVFYSLKSDASTIRVNILEQIDGEWKSVYDEPGYGAKIIAIDFCDLNKDGNLEVITRWSLYEAITSKTLAIHEVGANSDGSVLLETLVNQSYTYMGIADLNDDGNDEVLVTWLDTTDSKITKSYASLLYQNEDGQITQTGKNVMLDASVSSYASLKMQTVDGRIAAFLDAYKGDDTMITELIWWDNTTESLVAPLLDTNSLTNTQTLRSPAIASADINGDGLIEIPITENTDTSSDTQLDLFGWYIPTPDGLTIVSYGFINTSMNAYFKLPDGMKDHILAYHSTSEDVVTLYWTNDGMTLGSPLFSLVIKDTSSMTKDDTYTFKLDHDGKTIYGTLTSAGEAAGFSNDLITDSFVFLDDLT